MKKFFDWRSMSMLGVAASLVVLAAGSVEPNPNDPNNPDKDKTSNEVLGIPDDDQASKAPTVDNPNVNVSNPSIVVDTDKGHEYVAINLTGVWDEEATEWLKLYGTGASNQNLWVTIDDVPKGVDVYNNSDENSKKLIADVVFLVDNSGSMGEEAEAVASSIIEWSTILTESGLDLRVGCVGYGDANTAIDGALNISTTEELNNWMSNNGYGTNRTHSYGGEDADLLSTLANSGKYNNGSYNECGMVALHFAHDNFAFRSGSNRIYVNFTDEPNQPNNIEKWSVEYLNPENGNWQTNYGTVHTVFSEDKRYGGDSPLWNEKPWLMSDYTGGTTLFTDRYFTDFTLKNIPVTGAMQNSYVLRITNIGSLFDGQEHKVTITVYDNNGKIQAEKTVNFIFGTK